MTKKIAAILAVMTMVTAGSAFAITANAASADTTTTSNFLAERRVHKFDLTDHEMTFKYMTDTLFGLKIYDYFRNKDWFNLRTAANDNFWRYISVGVIPNIVAKRWGTNKDNYFWKQSNRLWPKTTWWYIHLTWHNSLEETRNILLDKRFNSDTIQGLVERTGKKGTFVDVYREIVYQYSLLDYNTIVKFKKQLSGGSDNLFRAIMRLNTARNLVTDPCLTKGGVYGYVSSIIYDLTINL